nr:hypothetical protein Cry52Nrm2_p060 [Cryptomonas curvata]
MKNFCKSRVHKLRNNGKSYIKKTNIKKNLENRTKISKLKYLEGKDLMMNIFNYSNTCKSWVKKFIKKRLAGKYALKKININKANNIYFNSKTNKNIFNLVFSKK